MTARGALRLLPTVMLMACGKGPAAVVDDAKVAALAATYVNGVGMGSCSHEKLTLAPDGRFDRSSIGQSAYRYSGTASLDRDMLVLDGLPEDRQLVEEIERFDYNRLHVVRWGERVYLINEFAMPMFCDAVNSGREPADDGPIGGALLREGDWLRPTTGLPDLPAGWASKLFHAPVEATIVEVVDSGAWINRGAADGLKPEMKLFLRDIPNSAKDVQLGGPLTENHELYVVEVEPTRSLVELQHPSYGPPLLMGMRVTSRLIDRP